MKFNRFDFLNQIFDQKGKDLFLHIEHAFAPYGSIADFKIEWGDKKVKVVNDKVKTSKNNNQVSFQSHWGEEVISFHISYCAENKSQLHDSFVEQLCSGYFLQEENRFLEQYVYQDDLTGVYNYRKFYKDIEDNIEKATSDNGYFSLVFIDIDRFKSVNDTYGHRFGSSLIQQLSEKLVKFLKSEFSIYRYGGDEFVFLCSCRRIHQLRDELNELITDIKSVEFKIKDDIKYQMSLSIGLAEFPTHGKTLQSMIDIADKMMYNAKKDGSKKVFLPEDVESDVA